MGVLAQLLLFGNDVYGWDYRMRVAGLLLGGLAVTCILYRKHRNREYKRAFPDEIQISRKYCRVSVFLCSDPPSSGIGIRLDRNSRRNSGVIQRNLPVADRVQRFWCACHGDDPV